jgi:hypothetical protein
MGLTGTILYLVAAPLLGIAATLLAKTGAARLFGYEQPSLRDMLSDLAEGIRQSPLPGERPPLYGTIVYLVGAAIAGAVFWYGSSLFVAALIWFIAAMAIPVSLCAQPSSGLWFQSPREATDGVVREILWIAALFFQSALLAIGLFLVSVFGIGAGSFLVSDAFAMGGAPVYYLPGCFIGIAIVLALYPRKEVEHWTLAADATGRSLLFLQLGRHYEQTLFYSIVFLLHFGGGATVIIALLICLLLAVLSSLLAAIRWHWLERPEVAAAIFILSFLAPVINLVLLLH